MYVKVEGNKNDVTVCPSIGAGDSPPWVRKCVCTMILRTSSRKTPCFSKVPRQAELPFKPFLSGIEWLRSVDLTQCKELKELGNDFLSFSAVEKLILPDSLERIDSWLGME
jgi:hypothetical protein